MVGGTRWGGWGDGLVGDRGSNQTVVEETETMTQARAVLDHAITEKDFQQAVVDLARLNGWMVHKVYDSRRSPEGWPDLFLVRDGKAYAWELKSERGEPTEAQAAWILALRDCGIKAGVVQPHDWDIIQVTLTMPRRAANGGRKR